MSSLLLFNRVYRLKIQSVMLVFSTQLVSCCPDNLLSGSPPPTFPESKYSVQCTEHRQCVGRVGRCWVVLETIFCWSLHSVSGQISEPRKLLYLPKQKPRRGGGLRQINTCRKVPLQVYFFRLLYLALLSISLNIYASHEENNSRKRKNPSVVLR